MAYIDFISIIHKKTERNYLERVTEEKPKIIEISKKYDFEYWDGDREYGYGGYYYDGRWKAVAEKIANHYGLKPGDSILDVGCGKGFLLYEFTQVLPGIQVSGIDISKYGIEHAKEEVKPYLRIGLAQDLPYPDKLTCPGFRRCWQKTGSWTRLSGCCIRYRSNPQIGLYWKFLLRQSCR